MIVVAVALIRLTHPLQYPKMMANKKGMPWKYLCDWDQLGSQRGYYTWAWEKSKHIWAILKLE